MVYVGDKQGMETTFEVFDFNPNNCVKLDTDNVNEVVSYAKNGNITWINVNGLNRIDDIKTLGNDYGIHPLILEDIVNTEQRPKIDEYEHYLFVVSKMLYFDEQENLIYEHLSTVIGNDFVITFQESEKDVFEPVRERLQNHETRVRKSGADYLGYILLDNVVDNYLFVIESMAERIEAIEDELFLESPRETITKDIQLLKHDILKIRRNVLPVREVIARIVKSESDLINEKTRDYYRDLNDHIIHIAENIDVYREMVWGLMEMYMTTISNKMNSIMKVLTIIATIFIPLTFLVGVYGMNFKHIPELESRYGYFILWGIMVAIFLALILYFRRKKWL